MLATVSRVAVAAAVYYIWLERNQVIFQQACADKYRVVQNIQLCVKLKLMRAEAAQMLLVLLLSVLQFGSKGRSGCLYRLV